MAVRPQLFRTDSKSKYNAKGKYAVGICHRSGFKYPLKQLKFEPGTNHFVHGSENDGDYSLVTHPQNFPPEKKTDRVALRWSFADVPLSIGTVVSADALYLPVFASVCNHWIDYKTSVNTAVSSGLLFNYDFNSQYVVIVFQGI